jgi:hypothetical protein
MYVKKKRLSLEEMNDTARQIKTAVQYKILQLEACAPTHSETHDVHA